MDVFIAKSISCFWKLYKQFRYFLPLQRLLMEEQIPTLGVIFDWLVGLACFFISVWPVEMLCVCVCVCLLESFKFLSKN